MDYKRLLAGFATAFITDRSKIGPVPLLAVNWLLVAVPAFLAFRAVGTDEFMKSLIIAALAFLVVVGAATVLSSIRVKIRARFYKTAKYSLGVPSYSDYSKDSSRFVKVRWNFLNASRVSFNITVSDVRKSSVTSTLNDLQSMFPQRSKTWVVDLGQLRQGKFIAHAVASSSIEAQRFDSSLAINGIAASEMSQDDFPLGINFVRDRIEDGVHVFDEVVINKVKFQFVSSYRAARTLNVFEGRFPSREGLAWVIDQSSRDFYCFRQEDEKLVRATQMMLEIITGNMRDSSDDNLKVTFDGDREEYGSFAFDSVLIEGMQAQALSEYKENILFAAMNTAFPLPPGYMWKASMMSGSMRIERIQGTKVPVQAESDYDSITSVELPAQTSVKATRPGLPPRPTFLR